MAAYYDQLETRDQQARADALARELPIAIANAKSTPAMAALLQGVDPARVTDLDALARLPVIRKAELVEAQRKRPPFGGYVTRHSYEFDHIFQSPGPVYGPGRREVDWWRLGRFLHASGVGLNDIVQNCFAYHMSPAGMMFESGARAVYAAVVPAGTGNTELQVRAALDVGTTCYAGTPDYLKAILDRADELGVKLAFTKAVVGGGALFASLRQEYQDRGIITRQCYATADLGCIAYESDALEGMIVDEGVLVEILRLGTDQPAEEGEVGEVVVTTLNPDYPLIRFATGDLSAVLSGQSPCGRTNLRIKGWMGRADQTTKIKGKLVRPEQVAMLISRHPEVSRVRVVVRRVADKDAMLVQIESTLADMQYYERSVYHELNLRGRIEIVPPGVLPNDGKLIDDQRTYD